MRGRIQCPLFSLSVNLPGFREHRAWDRKSADGTSSCVGCVYYPAVSLLSYICFHFLYLIIFKIFNWSIVHLQCVNFMLKGKWFRMHIFFYKFFSITGYYKILTIVSLPFFSFLILTSENKLTLVPLNLFILISLLL